MSTIPTMMQFIYSKPLTLSGGSCSKMKQNFNGSFDDDCLANLVSVSLLALVSIVLHFANITTQSNAAVIPQSAPTISQPLMYIQSQPLIYNSLVCKRELLKLLLLGQQIPLLKPAMSHALDTLIKSQPVACIFSCRKPTMSTAKTWAR